MMKTKTVIRALLLAAAMSTVTGAVLARSTPMAELGRQSIVTTESKPLSLQAVRKAIIAGGATHSWKPVADQPGVVTLQASSGQHQVVVDVAYDAQGYQITYKSSSNMNYEHSDSKTTIHPKYNKWIEDLNAAIRSAALGAKTE